MGLVSVIFVIEKDRAKQRYIVAMMDSHGPKKIPQNTVV